MAAKSILNELYQRLRTAAPVYKTQADQNDGFLCTLTLPAVQSDWNALATDRNFHGSGASKKEAEHAAANAAVEWLTLEKVLRPDGPSASQNSRGAAAVGAPSPTISSATSGVSLSGVGSKRSKSSADLDEESTESLELRILEALAAAYPRTLNGAQLAKMCGHFKLKSKVNHLLYMKLRTAGMVEMLDTHPPAWRVAGSALAALAAATAFASIGAATISTESGAAAGSGGITVGATSVPSITTDAAGGVELGEVTSAIAQRRTVAPSVVAVSAPAPTAGAAAAGSNPSRADNRQRSRTPLFAAATQSPSRPPVSSVSCGSGSPAPYARQPAVKQQKAGSRAAEQQQLSALLQQYMRQQQQQQSAACPAGSPRTAVAAAAAVAGLGLGPKHASAKSGTAGASSPSPSCSYGHSLHSHSHGQAQQQYSQSCGRSTTVVTAATAAAARQRQALAAAAAAVVAAPPSAAAAGACMRLTPDTDDDTDDDDISPAVLAAANEAATLEPAPFAVHPSTSGISKGGSQQQVVSGANGVAQAAPPGLGQATAVQKLVEQQLQQQQASKNASMLPHLDLLAAMQLNEQPQQQVVCPAPAPAEEDRISARVAQQQSQHQLNRLTAALQQQLRSLSEQAQLQDASAAASPAEPAGLEGPLLSRERSSSKPQLEAGTKRKYPASAWDYGRDTAAGGVGFDMLGLPALPVAQQRVGTATAGTGQQLLDPEVPQLPVAGTATTLYHNGHATEQHMQRDSSLQHHSLQWLPGETAAPQQLQHQLDLSFEAQQEHQQPQRRRRRSGHGPSAGTTQLWRNSKGSTANKGRQGKASSPAYSDAASSDGDSCDIDSTADMQTSAAAAANVRADVITEGGAGAAHVQACGSTTAADLAAALLHLSAGSITVQTEAGASCQQASGKSSQAKTAFSPLVGPHSANLNMASQQFISPAGTDIGLFSVTEPQQQLQGQDRPEGVGVHACNASPNVDSKPWQMWGMEGSPAPVSETPAAVAPNAVSSAAAFAAVGADVNSSNPWQLQWQEQQLLQQQLQGLWSNHCKQQRWGNECSSFATAEEPVAGNLLGTEPQQHGISDMWLEPSSLGLMQQHNCGQALIGGQQSQTQVTGIITASDKVSPTAKFGCTAASWRNQSPGMRKPLTSGMGTVEKEVGTTASESLRLQQHGEQQLAGCAAAADLQQSEEQALQLLSRLALPDPRKASGAAGGDGDLAPGQPPSSTVLPAEWDAATAPAAGSNGDASIPAGNDGAYAADDPFSVAVAAATAAAKAAAAVAAAVSFARGGRTAASAVCSLANRSSAATQDAPRDVPMQAEVAAHSGAAAPADASEEQHQQLKIPNSNSADAGKPTALVAAPRQPAEQATGINAALAAVPSGAAVVPLNLAEEYERRMGAVCDLVQQLNEALHGLNSIRGQVESV